ncbi:MAG: SDR family oxidoreductase [Planctomycetota bacterium]
MAAAAQRVLLTGATGYIGGRLAPELLDRGYCLTCIVRSSRKLHEREWAGDPRVDIVEADVLDTDAVREAAEGCDAAYYLIHSMESGSGGFAERDRELATSFASAIRGTSIERIVYLGGLGELGEGLSEHLRSRREVEQILEESGVPLTTLRAAIILGSGSASFEILRYLVERLPMMVTPKWVKTRCQPISVIDVLAYLVRVLETPETAGRCIGIGGPEVLTYRELMNHMTDALGLRRRIIVPLPVLTPKLSSLWIGLVTPVSPAIARPLAEGLRNEVIVRDDNAESLMPRATIAPRVAIERAVDKTRSGLVPTAWSAAGVVPGDPNWAGGTMFVDSRSIEVAASASAVFAAVCRVGGGHGWYAADYLWRLRGWMDKLMGGPGLRRGRRHPETVSYGEVLDFWRVTDVQRDKRLELRAEMKVPGVAELSFDIEPTESSNADAAKQRLIMTARFRPKGLLGLGYWYAVLPLHNIVFGGMLSGMKRAAESIQDGTSERPHQNDDADELAAAEATPSGV